MKHVLLMSFLSLGSIGCGGPVIERNSQNQWQEASDNYLLASLPDHPLSQLKLNLELELAHWPIEIRDGQYFEVMDIFSQHFQNLQTGELISAEEFRVIDAQSDCRGRWFPHTPEEHENLANGRWVIKSQTVFNLKIQVSKNDDDNTLKLAHSWFNFFGDSLSFSCKNTAKEDLTFLHLKTLFGAKNAVLNVPLSQ
jgi:hypothetical protein